MPTRPLTHPRGGEVPDNIFTGNSVQCQNADSPIMVETSFPYHPAMEKGCESHPPLKKSCIPTGDAPASLIKSGTDGWMTPAPTNANCFSNPVSRAA